MVLCCPKTTRIKGYPFEVALARKTSQCRLVRSGEKS
ncbi:hypothetical protein [Acetobacter senegalensis]|nr:hypothetical protein [Acetobacter senegalensis]